MKSFQPPAVASRSLVESTTTFNSPVTRRLLDYWDILRCGRARPRLRDFELMEIYEIAPTLVIRDLIDGGAEFRCRYWGTRLVPFFGFDATGKLLMDCYVPDSAEVLRNRMLTAMTAEMPIRVAGIVDLVDTIVPKSYEAVWLGLDDDDGRPAHAVAVFDVDYRLTPEDNARHQAATEADAIVYSRT